MRYKFTKMQSLGNDFIVLDGVSDEIKITANIARRLADRHFGIGCDQVLVVESGGELGRDGCDGDEFLFTIFNRDGSEAEQCGNGARCLAKFIHDRGLVTNQTTRNVQANVQANVQDDIQGKVIRARTSKLAMTLTINHDESVTVDMGMPEFSPSRIPFHADQTAHTYPLDLNGEQVEISALALGNPHAVRCVEDIARAPLETHGPLTENHARFPARSNAGFMQIAKRNHILLRVYERGAGETLGCGSGACAAVVVGVNRGLLDNRVKVSLPGGDAEVAWQGPGNSVFLTGSAHTVFCGDIAL